MFHKLQFMSSILKNKYLPSNKKYMEIQRREMSKFIIFMVLGGAAALVYANMGTLLQYAKKSVSFHEFIIILYFNHLFFRF